MNIVVLWLSQISPSGVDEIQKQMCIEATAYQQTKSVNGVFTASFAASSEKQQLILV